MVVDLFINWLFLFVCCDVTPVGRDDSFLMLDVAQVLPDVTHLVEGLAHVK